MRIDGLKVAKRRLALPKNGNRHVSQVTLADRAGLHWVTVSNIERGKAPNTTIDTLGRLAQALGCEIGDLLSDENGKPASDDEDESSMDFGAAINKLVERAVDAKLTARLADVT